MEEETLIHIHTVVALKAHISQIQSRNVNMSKTVLHGSQVQTLDTLESSGMQPSYVHL
jgi:hypothetical protein